MTELDRQSRIGDMSVEAADEYFQLLGAPGSFDIPITSGAVSPGVGNVGGGSGSGGPPFVSPNLAGIGASFSRAANLGNFLHSASVAQGGDGGGGGAVEGRDGDTISNPTPAVDSRPSLPSLSRASSSTTASPPSRSSPPRLHRRRGSTPFEMMMTTHTNQQQQQAPTAARSSMVVDRERERERDRDREAGRITAGMSSNAAGAPASADLPSSSPASRSSLPSESPSEAHQNSSYHSHSRRHSLSRTVTSFLRSQRSRTLASVTPDIETDRNVADRRRQLRERNESEWESQRPISSISTANASANRMSTDSTVMDAIMSDLPSSQSSDNPSGSGNSSSSDGTVVSTVESSTPNPSRYPTYFLTSPTGVPWVSPQPPGTSNRTESNDSSPMPTGPSRRDGAGNIPETHSLGSLPEASTSTGSSLATSALFDLPHMSKLQRPRTTCLLQIRHLGTV
ncbi:hypothetical protein DRE_07364 [Drechslerella stenobrocha 248]|uniref:Uncharacterized protein n=1 Tax=Drechslerella stenobrocha 248 TaxID=1043628 RepID=W7HIM4_9PEZI|nr:hypothetical protein DRE_07364 [Drechslerella stenobrocha 248]